MLVVLLVNRVGLGRRWRRAEVVERNWRTLALREVLRLSDVLVWERSRSSQLREHGSVAFPRERPRFGWRKPAA